MRYLKDIYIYLFCNSILSYKCYKCLKLILKIVRLKCLFIKDNKFRKNKKTNIIFYIIFNNIFKY